MKVLAVPQNFAHHVPAEPREQVADMVLFDWPVELPEGFDRVATPLICVDRLPAFRERWEALCPVVPPVEPMPIPEPPEDADAQ